MEIIKFASDDVANLLAQDPSRLDGLPFGAILIDREGVVTKYNKAESFMSGRLPEDVLGKNFFKDIAPCTKGAQFEERFNAGLASGAVNTVFEYAFTFEQKPTKVRVHMKTCSRDEGIWVFVKRL